MAYTGTPIVRNGQVWLAQVASDIRVDSPAWYWYAYLKSGNKLHNAYAGRTEVLSAARLNHIAQALLQKVRQQHTLADEKKMDGGD